MTGRHVAFVFEFIEANAIPAASSCGYAAAAGDLTAPWLEPNSSSRHCS